MAILTGTSFVVLAEVGERLPCRPKKNERFREEGGGLELISRFEFECCRCENFFFEGFDFLVCSCECAVACLCPRNSISNVVASVTIDENMYIYIYM